MVDYYSMAPSSRWDVFVICITYLAYHKKAKDLSALSKLARPVCLASVHGFVIVWKTLNDTGIAPLSTASCQEKCAVFCQVKDREYRYHHTIWSDILWVTLVISAFTIPLEIGIYVKHRYETKRLVKVD